MLIPPMRDGYSSNGALKQSKGSVFEGGIGIFYSYLVATKMGSRKPFSEVVHIADMLPTLMDIAGLEVPEVDGRSLKGALSRTSLYSETP